MERDMALKRSFTDHERYSLSSEEIKIGEKYLRKNKTAGIIPETESLKLFEMYLIGANFNELAAQFPMYPVERIIMTSALRGWAHDRDKMTSTLRDRVRAKVVKSVIEQVDFLTTMLSVSNAEHLKSMHMYILDPINNPKPDLRVMNIKEYKDVAETLYKIVAGSTPGSNNKASPMFDALTAPKKEALPAKDAEPDPASMISDAIDGQD
jgi:hypothetical protein